MKKQLYIFYICIGLVSMVTACDSGFNVGSQDLKEINEVGINLDSTYTEFFQDTLTIKPDLNFTLDTEKDLDRYKFKWVVYRESGLLDYEQDTLATTKDLNVQLTLFPGTYTAHYLVEDTQNGVRWDKEFELNVISPFYSGWMIMTDVNGKAKLGMVSKYTYQGVENVDTHADILEIANSSLELDGPPVGIKATGGSNTQIFVSSKGTGTTKIDPNTFQWEESNLLSYQFIESVPKNIIASYIVSAGFTRLLITESGDLYRLSDQIGVSVSRVSGQRVKVAPVIAGGIVYDIDNKRFLMQPLGDAKTYLIELGQGDLFDYQTGKELRFMGASSSGVFAILEDNNDTFYLARMRSSRITGSVDQLYYGEMFAKDIESASHFALSPVFSSIFYSVDGKLYQYERVTEKTKLMESFPGKTITYLGFDEDAPDGQNTLVVGLYDPVAPAAKSGMLKLYNMPAIMTDLTLIDSYSGFGKIVDVDYLSR